MADSNVFFSPYGAQAPYWIIANGPDAVALSEYGGVPLYHNAELYGLKAPSLWSPIWNRIVADHAVELTASGVEVAVISADAVPSMQDIELSLRSITEIDHVAKNLWLIEHLNAQRLVCFLQKVVDRKGQVVGHEAFARIEMPGGALIEGAAIMEASHVLHLEYQVDRLMHKQAVDCFAQAQLKGRIFINFLTDFIHRPVVYLEGLNQAVERHQLAPETIVLDISLPDYARHVAKLESIADYCRARGYVLALDRVVSAKDLAPMLRDIRPAYVKLDPALGVQALDVQKRESVAEIVRCAHAIGTAVIAENVESDALHQAYVKAEVDMFQGYFIGAPERCVSS